MNNAQPPHFVSVERTESMTHPTRRELLGAAAATAAAGLLPAFAHAQERRFAPEPGAWRSFEFTTRIELLKPAGAARAWLPIPSVDTEYQRSLDNDWTGNAAVTRVVADSHYGAKMLYAEFRRRHRVAGAAAHQPRADAQPRHRLVAQGGGAGRPGHAQGLDRAPPS